MITLSAIELTEAHAHNLLDAVNGIANAIHPEKIICYGVKTSKIESWGSFRGECPPEVNTCLELLIITKEETHNKAAIMKLVRSYNTDTLHIIAIVQSMAFAQHAIQSGKVYFSALYLGGIMLYESNATP